MTDTTTKTETDEQTVKPLGDHFASSEPVDGTVKPQGDHFASSEPVDGTVKPQGDHFASSEPKVPGHVPERDGAKAEAEGGSEDGAETQDDHHASGEPKGRPGVAPVDHFAS